MAYVARAAQFGFFRQAGLIAATAGALFLIVSAPFAQPQQVPGYLSSGEMLHVERWLPAYPVPDSVAGAADVQAYFATRALIGTPQGNFAAADDTYEVSGIASRFSDALGVTLTARNAPQLYRLMSRVQHDAEVLPAPVKRSVRDGGRHRPFVDYPGRRTCPITYAQLPETGSYPSGHAILGWLWGSILAEVVPDRADAFIARGIRFGDSRVICGFHYSSDVAASRLAGAALLARLHADPEFIQDLSEVRREMAHVRASAGAPSRG